ncbi:MAG TPA: hypothetical protein DDW23_02705 [Planctomycetes bacterium]|nr:hypothetical protein [Planctomycetota bacterium]
MLSLTKALRLFLIPFRVLKGLVFNRRSFLHQTGWIKSQVDGRPLAVDGESVPWMNYPIISFLRERIPADAIVFEFGAGASTEFFAKYGERVVSIEHDALWFKEVKESLPENVVLEHVPLDAGDTYPSFITEHPESFDLVIVDGRRRVDCFSRAIESLSVRGCIVLDDSNRRRYRQAFQMAEQSGFRYIHFEGMKPRGRGIARATIFYRDQNCFAI